jgi:hypothetical protein
VLAVSAAALAFLLASHAARQAEVWTHLARGRALLGGLPRPDRDPALLAPALAGGEYQSPLYDLALCAGFRSLGGAGLVALSAAAAAALAVAVFLAGRSAARPVPAGVCAMLAVLGLAPWLGLTPVLPSCLFLAILLLLVRNVAAGRAAWLVPALVAVWANVDRWVVLGPVVVGLFALGAWRRGDRVAAKLLGRTFLAALVASLFSPNLFEVWDPSRWVGLPASGPLSSPFWPAWYRTQPPAVGAAHVALALMGLLALRPNPDSRATAWAPVWLALLGLSIVVPAAAPFFAVAAVPVAAEGLSRIEWRRTAGAARGPRWLFASARWAMLLLAWAAPLALLAAAWPGWLAGPPYGRPEWSLPVDDSLRDAVRDVALWRREGSLPPEGRGVTLSPEVAAYWSWFEGRSGGEAPGQPDWAAVRAGLLDPKPSGETARAGLRDFLRERRVDHLILHVDGGAPAEQVMTRLSGSPDEWPLLYLRGRTAVFGWHDPAPGSGPSAAGRLEPERRAFLPGPDDRAPPEGPSRRPGERRWSRAFTEPPPAPSPARDEAGLYLAYFDGHRASYDRRTQVAWLSAQNVGLLGALAGPVIGLHSAADIGQWAFGAAGDWTAFQSARDDGPLGAPLLAVRAARRAILADPDDAKSYFLLGEAYLRLSGATRERAWRHQLPAFDRIRQVQAITAYTQALALRPDSPAAHGRLARLYRDRGSLDLALRHLDRLVEVSRARGPEPGQDAAAARESLKELEGERDALRAEVRRREETWGAGKGSRRVLDLASEASALGLPDRALQLLLKSDASEFGPDGVKLELDLLLWAGRAHDVREWMNPELEQTVGAVTYHEVLGCAAAALGDYDEAGRELRTVAASFLHGPSRLPTPQTQGAYDVARAMLATPFVGNPVDFAHESLVREGLVTEVSLIRTNLAREANVVVVEGLIALEAGQVEEAAATLGRAVQKSGSGGAGARPELDFSGLSAARDCLRLLAGPAHRR